MFDGVVCGSEGRRWYGKVGSRPSVEVTGVDVVKA